MQSSVELAFGQHCLDIARFFKKAAASILVAAKETGGYQSDCHHFGSSDSSLRGVLVASALQKIVAKAVNRDDLSNLAVHGGSFWQVVGGTSTIPEARQAQNQNKTSNRINHR